MPEMDDMGLLREYAKRQSEQAFSAIVERHVALVYSVAFRTVGNSHAAQDITQAVFVILARKAQCLSQRTILSGWLYQTTRLTAARFLRTEIRRQQREQEAYMQSLANEPEQQTAWPQIAPLLDAAMERLGKKDRDAIVLRYFENKDLREVGAALGASEAAARMRIVRALEKLRKLFSRRGLTLSAAAIAGAVSANSVHAAPAGLTKMISAAALAKGATAGSSILTLVKGVLKIMAWTKTKTAIVIGATVVLAGTTTTVVVQKLSWANNPKYWKLDARVLESDPAAFILRPSHFPFHAGAVSVGQRFMCRGANVASLIDLAHGYSKERTIFPQGMPTGDYDLMLTVPDHPKEKLKEEIVRRFGYVARVETRETNVLLLEVQHASATGLRPSSSLGGQRSRTLNNKELVLKNYPIGTLRALAEIACHLPVLDRTGLDGKYDITLHFDMDWKSVLLSRQVFKHLLADQLGLELVPARKPVKMLVVKKAK